MLIILCSLHGHQHVEHLLSKRILCCRCKDGAGKLLSKLPELWPADHLDGPEAGIRSIQICSGDADQKVEGFE